MFGWYFRYSLSASETRGVVIDNPIEKSTKGVPSFKYNSRSQVHYMLYTHVLFPLFQNGDASGTYD